MNLKLDSSDFKHKTIDDNVKNCWSTQIVNA